MCPGLVVAMTVVGVEDKESGLGERIGMANWPFIDKVQFLFCGAGTGGYLACLRGMRPSQKEVLVENALTSTSNSGGHREGLVESNEGVSRTSVSPSSP